MTKPLALITGVSRPMGLGFETARQLAGAGFEVIISAREKARAKEMRDLLRAEFPDIVSKTLDITSDKSVRKIARFIEENYGKLDVLINNAGAWFDAKADVLEVDFEFARRAFETNLFGAWRMAVHF